MTEHEDLIAEAHEHLDKAADAAPVSARQAILTGKVEDQRMSLVARLVHALEKVTAERDVLSSLREQMSLRLRYVEGKREQAEAERDGLESRLAELLCEITDGRMSNTGYDVRTMVHQVEDVFERAAQDEIRSIEAERDELAAVIREALGVARSGSVPLGVQEARHFDRLLAETRRALNEAPSVALDRVKAEARAQVAAEIEADGEDTEDGYGYDAYINGLRRAATIAREGR